MESICLAIFQLADSAMGDSQRISLVSRVQFNLVEKDICHRSGLLNYYYVVIFTASYLGIKDLVPPYFNKSLSFEELKTGVSFASAGSGFDPLTAQATVCIQRSN